jgi:putative ABC transport system permease protein
MTLLRRSSFRHMRQHRAQLALAVLGVALGVAVVVAINLAIESSRAAFRASTEAVVGRATHQLLGATGTIDEELFVRVRTELGIERAAPVVEGLASSPLLPGRALRVLGVDPFSEAPFRTYVAGTSATLDLATFITTPGAVVLSAATAAEAGVVPGDTLPVHIEGVARRLPVTGVLDSEGGLERVGLNDVLVMDISGAQDLLGLAGRLSHVDLRMPGGAAGTDAAERLRAAIPGGVRLQAAGTREETLSGMIAAFDLNLTALSLLALIFGMFLIYNAMTFSVVQRRELLGRLRTLGVTRAQIVRLILGEALLMGIAGAALGVALGVILGRGLVRLVVQTINDLYFVVSVEAVRLEPLVLVGGAALGIAATLLAALPPALEAAAATPRVATLRSTAESGARRAVAATAVAGGALLSVGAAALALPTGSLLLGFGALFVAILGMALLTPAGTVLLVRVAAPALAAAMGVLGRLASRGIVASLSRVAPAIAALAVAVSVTVGLGIMIHSFRGTLVDWLENTLQADLYVSLPGPRASVASGTLPAAIVDTFSAHDAVVGRNRYRNLDLVSDGEVFRLIAIDLDPLGEAAFEFLEGSRGEALSALRAGHGALVSEPFAYRRSLSVGDSLVLPTPTGERRVPVAGVFYDYGSEQGTVMIARGMYDAFYDDAGVTSLGLFLADDADEGAVARDLLARVPEGRTIVVRTNRALRTASLEVFDRTFRVTAVLRLLAFVVAFVGVLGALMALELERARELGVLRASGLTPGQVWQLVITQTGLIGLVAGLLAIPMGLALATVMIFVINKRSFGWTLDMSVGPAVLAQALALALLGAILAGLYPAWKMSRTSPALALRGE